MWRGRFARQSQTEKACLAPEIPGRDVGSQWTCPRGSAHADRCDLSQETCRACIVLLAICAVRSRRYRWSRLRKGVPFLGRMRHPRRAKKPDQGQIAGVETSTAGGILGGRWRAAHNGLGQDHLGEGAGKGRDSGWRNVWKGMRLGFCRCFIRSSSGGWLISGRLAIVL